MFLTWGSEPLLPFQSNVWKIYPASSQVLWVWWHALTCSELWWANYKGTIRGETGKDGDSSFLFPFQRKICKIVTKWCTHILMVPNVQHIDA